MITFRNVSFSYFDNTPLLSDVSFDINSGEIVLLEGSNGIGKTTLVKLLIGLIFPQSGTIEIRGLSVPHEIDKVIDQGLLGYIFTNPDHQTIQELVYEEIAFALENKKLPFEIIQEKIVTILQVFGIGHLRNALYETLSRSERKMVSLASVLVAEPQYVILDDPTCWLDNESKILFLNACKSFFDKENRSMFFISHEADAIACFWKRQGIDVRRYQMNEGIVMQV